MTIRSELAALRRAAIRHADPFAGCRPEVREAHRLLHDPERARELAALREAERAGRAELTAEQRHRLRMLRMEGFKALAALARAGLLDVADAIERAREKRRAGGNDAG